MKDIYPKSAEDKNERMRRLKASFSASHHRRELLKNLNKESMEALMKDPALNDKEKDTLSGRINNRIREEYRNRLEYDVSIESFKELMQAELLTPNQKVSIVNSVREYCANQLGRKDDALDKALASLLVFDNEKTDILFSLNDARDGKFKFKSLTLSDIERLIEEAKESVEG